MSGDRTAGERHCDCDEKRWKGAKAKQPPAAIAIGQESEDADKGGFAEAEDGDEGRSAFVAKAMEDPEQRIEAVDRGRGDADQERCDDQRSGKRESFTETESRIGRSGSGLRFSRALVANCEGDEKPSRQRQHDGDKGQDPLDPGGADHQRAKELGTRIEHHGEGHDAAALAIVDNAVEPDFGGGPKRCETGAHDEPGREPDGDMIEGDDCREAQEGQGVHCCRKSRQAKDHDQARQERSDEEDAGARQRRVEADEPVGQTDIFEGERKIRVGEGGDDGLDRHEQQDAGDRPGDFEARLRAQGARRVVLVGHPTAIVSRRGRSGIRRNAVRARSDAHGQTLPRTRTAKPPGAGSSVDESVRDGRPKNPGDSPI